jgi:hypothetical protein
VSLSLVVVMVNEGSPRRASLLVTRNFTVYVRCPVLVQVNTDDGEIPRIVQRGPRIGIRRAGGVELHVNGTVSQVVFAVAVMI